MRKHTFTYTIYETNGTESRHSVEWPKPPHYSHIAPLVEPLLGGYLERVRVLFEDKYLDMFVHETGRIDGLPRNEKATAISRNNWLKAHPNANVDQLPYIAGKAILFHQPVLS